METAATTGAWRGGGGSGGGRGAAPIKASLRRGPNRRHQRRPPDGGGTCRSAPPAPSRVSRAPQPSVCGRPLIRHSATVCRLPPAIGSPVYSCLPSRSVWIGDCLLSAVRSHPEAGWMDQRAGWIGRGTASTAATRRQPGSD